MTTEEIVAAEQAEYENKVDEAVKLEAVEEPAEPEQTEEPPAAEEALFDRSQFEREELQIEKVDGIGIDKIRVKFSGSVMLDRSDPADVALYNRLRMGRDVELRCAGKVAGAGAGWTTNREGNLDAVVGEKTVKVDTVWVLEPEQLG